MSVLHRPKSKATTKLVVVNPAKVELESLKDQFGKQSSIAHLLGVDRSSVNRWLQGDDVPDPENDTKIAALRYVMARLSEIYLPEVASNWLLGINAFLMDRRPIDMLRDGRVAEVVAAIEQTKAGSYA